MLWILGLMNIYQKENKIIGFGIMPALKFPVWAFSCSNPRPMIIIGTGIL